ncbi:CBASS oligonucleotide cyclase [Citricoccus nitrophenolicus]|uniref:CBASS oligonucleotide cyclase n=1 Tax=Citricoccus nitrophenolicus TaxID=863575 RepID=A0ABV0INT5_9MICC
MGGSGGGSNWSGQARDPQRITMQALQDLKDKQLRSECNEVLDQLLKEYNDRDTEAVAEKMTQIEEALNEGGYELDRLLFGGSVAKHTYVDGLSDVDSIVYLGDNESKSPAQVLDQFAEILRTALPANQVESVTTGRMAVTVAYHDGTLVQLLPATERGTHTVLPSPDGKGWRAVRPHKFTEKLTQVNQKNSHQVVPAIKLAKRLMNSLPEAEQLSGYHVEALAVDAFKSYEKARDRASVLHHLLTHASQAVLRPTADITGQTVHIDEHLGPASSGARKRISTSLRRIADKLDNVTTARQYQAVFE